jgi:hypothetical protein
MKAHIIIFILTLTCLAAGTAVAQVDLQLGTRPQGMGGAFVAVANDANAVYWNPSGLSQITRGEVTLMHWLLSDISQVTVDYGSVVYPLYTGAIGFAINREAAELEEGVNDDKSTMSHTTITLSYGMPITRHVAAGASFNRYLIDSRVATGGGMGFDFGVFVKPLGTDRWTLGATAKYIGANLKNENLLPYYSAGSAFRINTRDSVHNFLIAADVITRQDIDGKDGTSFKVAAGLEYQLMLKNVVFAARGGIGTKNYTAGVSVGYKFISIDYAFVTMNEETIGNSHKFGLGFRF